MRLLQNLLCIGALLASFGAGAAETAPEPKNGQQFTTLAEQQNTDGGSKVEVVEFFAYYCPHCNSFEPKLAEWVRQQGDKIVFKRVHVGGGGGAAQQQHLFYTLDALGLVPQYHAKVFGAIHDEHQRLNTEEQVLDWVAKAGIDRAKYSAAASSFGVQAKLRRANSMMSDYKIEYWPQIAIDGHYLTSPSMVGETMPSSTEPAQQQAVLKVMDYLLAKAQAEKKR
ncbi:MAG: thiol:disulfide interchange protein DsbA/DsbL [Massilia sp.]